MWDRSCRSALFLRGQTPPPKPTTVLECMRAQCPGGGRPSHHGSLSPAGDPGLPAVPEHRSRSGASAQLKRVTLLLLRVARVVPVTASETGARRNSSVA